MIDTNAAVDHLVAVARDLLDEPPGSVRHEAARLTLRAIVDARDGVLRCSGCQQVTRVLYVCVCGDLCVECFGPRARREDLAECHGRPGCLVVIDHDANQHSCESCELADGPDLVGMIGGGR